MITNYEAIKLLIEESVRCDIYGDLWGHERVAENLAEQFDALERENEQLKLKLRQISDILLRSDKE